MIFQIEKCYRKLRVVLDDDGPTEWEGECGSRDTHTPLDIDVHMTPQKEKTNLYVTNNDSTLKRETQMRGTLRSRTYIPTQ